MSIGRINGLLPKPFAEDGRVSANHHLPFGGAAISEQAPSVCERGATRARGHTSPPLNPAPPFKMMIFNYVNLVNLVLILPL
ncbi:MAG: hypothetical protein ACI8W7_005058 [Gammaproteobacteria bacterium]